MQIRQKDRLNINSFKNHITIFFGCFIRSLFMHLCRYVCVDGYMCVCMWSNVFIIKGYTKALLAIVKTLINLKSHSQHNERRSMFDEISVFFYRVRTFVSNGKDKKSDSKKDSKGNNSFWLESKLKLKERVLCIWSSVSIRMLNYSFYL